MGEEHIPYEQLIAYAVRELNTAELASITAHTSICAKCNATVVRFRKIRALLRADYVREPPVATVARAQAIFARRDARAQPTAPHVGLPSFFQVARRFSVAVALAAILFILVLFFGGVGTVAAATRESLPGETLYPVKIAVESLQLAATPDPVNKAELHLALAETRVKEIESLNAKGENENIAATAQSYADQIDEAEKLLTLAKGDNLPIAAAGGQMEQVLTRSVAVLTTLLGTVPVQVKPEIARAIDVSQSAMSEARKFQTLPPISPATPPSKGKCEDSAPPSLMVSVSPNELWPANQEYVTVRVTVKVTDNTDLNPRVVLVSVTSSEPDNSNDMVVVDNFMFKLRAERTSNGPGRVYTITYSATDACGNVKRASATVTVPRDKAPPGQETPPGQQNTPPGQQKTPPGQQNTPPGQKRTP